MDIIVCLKQVPDLVEEFELSDDGTGLNRDFMKLVLNEFDDWALEQALLLKEQSGGTVTCLSLDTPEVDNTLFTCLAKGADRAVKIEGDYSGGVTSHQAARLFTDVIRTMPHDLILTGVQSVEDLDGQNAVLLATYLNLPHVSVVTGVDVNNQQATVRKEYAGGMLAEFQVALPAVLGIQAARQAPRYAPISRVRAMMKEKKIELCAPADGAADAGVRVRRMFKPESGKHAEMLDGDTDTVADRIVGILKERALLR